MDLVVTNFWVIAAVAYALLFIETAALSVINYRRERKKTTTALIAISPLPLLILLLYKPLFLAGTLVGGVAALGVIVATAIKHPESMFFKSNWIEEEGRKERDRWRKKNPGIWADGVAKFNEK